MGWMFSAPCNNVLPFLAVDNILHVDDDGDGCEGQHSLGLFWAENALATPLYMCIHYPLPYEITNMRAYHLNTHFQHPHPTSHPDTLILHQSTQLSKQPYIHTATFQIQ